MPNPLDPTNCGPLPPVEPSAIQRAGAKEMRGMYLALVAEGFTETQALAVLGYMLAGGQR